MEIKTITPYSHHHRNYAMMVGSIANQAVFEYLMDEYQFRMKMNRPLEDIPFSVNNISRARNINRRTVSNAIQSLCTMRLIDCTNDTYTLDGDLYMSLINAFSSLKMTEKVEFARLLQNGEIDALSKFGFQYQENAKEELRNMVGELDISSPEVVQKCTGLCKNTQRCAEIHNPVQKCTTLCKNAQGCAKMHNFFEDFKVNFDDFCAELCKNAQGCAEIHKVLVDKYAGIMQNDTIELLLEAVMTPDDQKTDDFYALGLCIFTQVGCAFLHNRNNNIKNKIKKENTEIQSISYKRKEEKDLTDEEGFDFNLPESPEENDEPLNFQVDSNMMGAALNKYQLYKKQQKLPFFPASKINELTSNIHECLDRADKLFIFQVWNILHELFDTEEEIDEENNVAIPASHDVEKAAIVKERLEKDILFPALESTLSILKAGYIENINGEKLPVTAEPIPEDYYGLIIEWPVKTTLEGECYIVSASRIHDIYAEQVNVQPGNVKTQRGGVEGREDDFSYMQKILQIGFDDNLYTKLTPIELAAYNLLIEYFQVSDEGEIVEPKDSFLPERTFRSFLFDIKESCPDVTKEDIISVIFNNKIEEGGVALRNRMFSAQKIRNWNAKHALQSIVDDYNKEEAVR